MFPNKTLFRIYLLSCGDTTLAYYVTTLAYYVFAVFFNGEILNMPSCQKLFCADAERRLETNQNMSYHFLVQYRSVPNDVVHSS